MDTEGRGAAVLFDLDGTLVDSSGGIIHSYRYAFDALGERAPSEECLRATIGLPLEEVFQQFLADGGLGRVEEAVEAYRDHYAQEGVFENQLYAGVAYLLKRLGSQGHRLFVATAKPTVFAETVLAQFGLSDAFEAICGRGLDGSFADKSALVRHILHFGGLDPGQSLMVGDRAADIRAGKANGIATTGVTYGFGTEKELRQAGADRVVDSPGEIGGIEALKDVWRWREM